MKNLSHAEAALLGLLSEQPMHPYQIEQQVRHRDMRSWTELSMSAIYKMLVKLEKDDLIERTDSISAENRLRKLYSMNERGRDALKKKIESLLSQPEHVRWAMDIGVYNCHLLAPDDVKNALESYREALEKRIKDYEALKEFLVESGCPRHRLGVASRPIFLALGEIAWIDSFLHDQREDAPAPKRKIKRRKKGDARK